jgi:hypothetical protein
MTFKRKIKYQINYLRRYVENITKGGAIPEWLKGRVARGIYLGILIILVFAYVREVSSAASSGYEMRDLQNKVSVLNEEIRGLDVQVAAGNSLPVLEKRIEGSGLTRVDNITYLNVVGSVVAKK